MFGKVNIGGKEVAMAANAATPFFFTQLFKQDFFVESQKVTEGNEGAAVDLFSKVGFIMAKQAEFNETPAKMHALMNKLSLTDYIAWLEEFEAMDIAVATGDIATIYSGQATPSTKAKN